MLSSIKDYDVINKVPMTRFDGPNGSKVYLVHTKAEWEAFYELLMQQSLVACDTESSGFYYFKNDRICGMSFGWGVNNFYIPVRHKDSIQGGIVPGQLNMDDIRDQLRAFFARQDVTTIWHNWKFDAHMYKADGIEILTPFHDTRILWQLFDENAPGALKTIVSGWTDDMGRWQNGLVDRNAAKWEQLISKWRMEESRLRKKEFNALVAATVEAFQKDPIYQSFNKRDLKAHVQKNELLDCPYRKHAKDDVTYDYVSLDLMFKYAGLDTFYTWRVYEHVIRNLSFGPKLRDLYDNEIQLSRALFDAEEAGIRINRDYLISLGKKFDAEIESLTTSIRAVLGDINLNSPKQLADALVNHGCVLTKTTESGALSVDAKVLKKLAKKHEIVKEILKLRAAEKLNGTYVQGILNKLTDDNILHCSFNQNVATGRMSSMDPNLQNIPGKDTSIRRAFECIDNDYVLVFADYSQIEVRLTAHFSQDPLLLDAYLRNQDVHTRTMCEMFGYNINEVQRVLDHEPTHPLYKEWSDLRKVAKIINFGIIYGVSAAGLSEQIVRPDQYQSLDDEQWVDVCKSFIDNYLDKYRGVRKFVRQSSREVAQNGKISNHFGRIRHLPHANAIRILKDNSKFWLEARAKRQGVNFVVQGTAADLFKIAVVRVRNLLAPYRSRIVNFVHDEIQIYLHKEELFLLPQIKRAMEDFKFSVPIVANFDYSTTNWAEKKSLE